MRQAYLARNAAEAHMLAAMLEGEGIKAVVQAERLTALAGQLPANICTEVHVLEDADLPRARELLRAYEARKPGEAGAGPPWICPACKEECEGNFDACWNCGAERPATAS